MVQNYFMFMSLLWVVVFNSNDLFWGQYFCWSVSFYLQLPPSWVFCNWWHSRNTEKQQTLITGGWLQWGVRLHGIATSFKTGTWQGVKFQGRSLSVQHTWLLSKANQGLWLLYWLGRSSFNRWQYCQTPSISTGF